jgi:hypothetical protein
MRFRIYLIISFLQFIGTCGIIEYQEYHVKKVLNETTLTIY